MSTVIPLSNKRSVKGAMMALLITNAALSGCSSTDLSATTTLASPTTPVTLAASRNVADIAQGFRQAVNAGDAELVASLAPTTPTGTREFLIGGGPYETVDCYQFDGRDECHVVNGIADFTFTVDVTAGLVTDVTYVGGE